MREDQVSKFNISAETIMLINIAVVGVIFFLAVIIPDIIQFSNTNSKVLERLESKQKDIDVLVMNLDYTVYLDGKEVSLDKITKVHYDDNNYYTADNVDIKLVDTAIIDNDAKCVYYYTNITQQVDTLTREAGFKVLLNNEEIDPETINTDTQYVFIDYDNKQIVVSAR